MAIQGPVGKENLVRQNQVKANFYFVCVSEVLAKFWLHFSNNFEIISPILIHRKFPFAFKVKLNLLTDLIMIF